MCHKPPDRLLTKILFIPCDDGVSVEVSCAKIGQLSLNPLPHSHLPPPPPFREMSD